MDKSSDVVIVGAGAAGCATAYFLAKQGVKPTIIEKVNVASQASGFAAGTLHPLESDGMPGPLGPWALEGLRTHINLWDQLKEESGIDFHGRQLHLLRVAFDEEDVAELRHLYQSCQQVPGFVEQFSIRWLTGEEVMSLEPRVSPQVTNALYLSGIGALDSYRYTLALQKAAEHYGATLHHGEVEGLIGDNGRVSGVVLKSGEIACDKVVIAMGPWSGEAERWLGVPVPIGPLKGQILRMELPGPPLKHVVYHHGSYVASKPDGLIWAGTTEEEVGFDCEPTLEARQAIMKDAVKIMPTIADAKLVLQTACLRPISPDRLPVISQVPGWEGVFLATGGGRKGILVSPLMGQAAAELVTQGHTQIDISPFSLERFIGPRHEGP